MSEDYDFREFDEWHEDDCAEDECVEATDAVKRLPKTPKAKPSRSKTSSRLKRK